MCVINNETIFLQTNICCAEEVDLFFVIIFKRKTIVKPNEK